MYGTEFEVLYGINMNTMMLLVLQQDVSTMTPWFIKAEVALQEHFLSPWDELQGEMFIAKYRKL